MTEQDRGALEEVADALTGRAAEPSGPAETPVLHDPVPASDSPASPATPADDDQDPDAAP